MLSNSHTYDFALAKVKKDIEIHLKKAESLPKNEKLAILSNFVKKLESGINNFHIIVADYNYGNAKNYDTSNNIDAIDLLCICAELSEIEICSKDVIELTSIQLEDISGGPCPIGRVARLLQVVTSFIEFL